MKEFFKDKKVIVTGNQGFKRAWIMNLLREWEADIITNQENDHVTHMKHIFQQEQPEIVFHISSSPHNFHVLEMSDTTIASPYVSTSHVLDAIRTTPSVTSAVLIPAEKVHKDKAWHPQLTDDEKEELANLLKKANNVEIRGEIWHQLVVKFITVPIELCILNERNEVFLVYRKDREFDGYHMPGTVVNDWEDVTTARTRLVHGEVMIGAGFSITDPHPIGWLEVGRGEEPYQDRHRHAVSLLHIARTTSEFTPREGMGFYPFDEIPKNTLGHHQYLLTFFKRYLHDKQIILGE